MKDPPGDEEFAEGEIPIDDGVAFTVSQFIFEYADAGRPGLPLTGSSFFDDLIVTWGVNEAGAYVTPTREIRTEGGADVVKRENVSIVRMTLREFRERGGGVVHQSGIRQVQAELTRRFNDEAGILGMFSVPDPDDISL
ncbi:MAG TPA: hypothetical protein PKU91_05800, partial [Phycisphaerales bacterium]|nr:hypothetical protein [Phycisphaerales bacterium]